MSAGKFELFHITYKLPKFGSDGKEFMPEEHLMMVSTPFGEKDAIQTCERYHSGCKIEKVVKRKGVK